MVCIRRYFVFLLLHLLLKKCLVVERELCSNRIKTKTRTVENESQDQDLSLKMFKPAFTIEMHEDCMVSNRLLAMLANSAP